MNKHTCKNVFFTMLSLTMLTGLSLGCSNTDTNKGATASPDKSSQPTATAKPLEPVTLKIYASTGYLSAQDFEELISGPVKKKYPHLTVEQVNNGSLPQVITSGSQIDFYVTWHGEMNGLKDLNVFTDIIPMAKKHNFDLNKFSPQVLDQLKEISGKGELYALPYATILSALYYNKDIFDRFGVPYPQDGMIWEEAIELGRKLTRTDGTTKYEGLGVAPMRFLYQLSANFVDAKTDEVKITGELYQKAFNMGKLLYSIPGNEYKTGSGSVAQFQKERNLAMLGDENRFLNLRETPDLNWDVAQYPNFKELPNIAQWNTQHVIIPIKTSKYSDDQMRVMEVLFTDEVQTILAGKTLRVSTLSDPKYKQLFGQAIPELKGKKLSSIFKSTNAPIPLHSIHWGKAQGIISAEFNNAVSNKKDVNTALRDAQEQIQSYITTQKGK